MSARYLRQRDQLRLRRTDWQREPELEFPRQGEGWGAPGHALEHRARSQPDWVALDRTQLDCTWIVLRRRLEQARPFNPVLMPREACSPGVDARRALRPRVLEARLLEHVAACRQTLDDALLGGRLLHERVLGGDPELTRRELAALWSHLADELELAIALLCFRPFWIRSPLSWKPSEQARGPSLVEHLLLRYPVPRVLLAQWLGERVTFAKLRPLVWTVAIGQGLSLRRLARLALERRTPGAWTELPKKFPRLLFEVPAHVPFSRVSMFIEVRRCGGSGLEYRRLSGDASFFGDPLRSDALERSFFEGAVRWLTRHREQLTDLRAREVLAWARHRQTEARRHRGPAVGARPHSWTARSYAATLREAEAYRATLQGPYYRHRYGWRPRPALRWRSWGWDWSAEIRAVKWEIRELNTSALLEQEGQAMRHCVRVYDRRCYEGNSAIFSVRADDKRVLTIELEPNARRIAQVHGKCNRGPTKGEQALVDRWLAEVVRSADGAASSA